jgi:hypothetical protein
MTTWRKNKKYEIQVRIGDRAIGYIERVLYMKIIGNFNPVYCRYNNQEYLVKSEEGDISDPFRREESYLKTLYIEV